MAQRNFSECHVHEVWSSILGGVNQDFFPPSYTSNQNFLCTLLGCLKPVEGIKKVLTFSKIGYLCCELFSHVFTPSEIFLNIPRVG